MKEKIGIDKIWNDQSDAWDKRSENNDDFWTKKSKYIVELLLRHASKKGKILEGGCGAGLLSQLLRNHGFEVYGYDISPNMIDITRKRVFGERNENLEHFRVCTKEKIPFDSMKFDIFVGNGLFPYITNYNSYIVQISKFLNLNGLVIVSNINRCSISVVIEVFQNIYLREQNWGIKIINLIRTGIWEGGYVDYKTSKQVHNANSFDKLFLRNGFKKIDELCLFRFPLLDQDPLHRGYLNRKIVRYFGWNYIGVYQKISEI